MMFRVFLAAMGCLLVAGAAGADVHLWRDASGSLRYSADAPGPDARDARRLRATAGFSCAFAGSLADCGFQLQAKARARASIEAIGGDGRKGLRLRTEPGDDHIAGSGAMERSDVYLSQADTGCYEGREQWWEHSILFPEDFALPTWQMYVVFDFHGTGAGPQANFHLNFAPQADPMQPGNLIFRGYGGSAANNWGEYKATIGQIRKNVWYEFAYHVRWSSGSDGFFEAWVDGVNKLSHHGPTLYAGQGCYLKLANYHTPVCDPYPGCTGPASSVIHGRLSRRDVGAS